MQLKQLLHFKLETLLFSDTLIFTGQALSHLLQFIQLFSSLFIENILKILRKLCLAPSIHKYLQKNLLLKSENTENKRSITRLTAEIFFVFSKIVKLLLGSKLNKLNKISKLKNNVIPKIIYREYLKYFLNLFSANLLLIFNFFNKIGLVFLF